jgi:FkbM family methyltransferase
MDPSFYGGGKPGDCAERPEHAYVSGFSRALKKLFRETLRMTVRRMPYGGHRLVNKLNPSLAVDTPVMCQFDGQWMEVNLHDHIQKELYYFGTYEPVEQAFFIRYLKTGMTVVDIGAHIGLYTLLAAKRIGQEGKVIAFEPVPGNFQRLKRNIELNGWKNVVLEQYALSQIDGEATILLPDYANSGVPSIGTFQNHGEWREALRVRTSTLDSYVAAHSISRVDLVKMDIQGAEIWALQGMQQVLSAREGCSPDVLCELHPGWLEEGFNSSPIEVKQLLHKCGYTMYRIVGTDALEHVPPDSPHKSSDMLFCTKASARKLRARFGMRVR